MARRLKKAGAETSEMLDQLVSSMARIKTQSDALKEERQETSSALLNGLKDAGKSKHRVSWTEDHDAVASIRERDNSKIDPERLKKAIGAKQFDKLTSPQLDMAKVEAAVQLGELDPNIVAQCTDESVTEYVDVRFNKAQKRKGE